MINHGDKAAIILSPRQTGDLVAFVDIIEAKLLEDRNFFDKISDEFVKDTNLIDEIKEKALDIAAGRPRVFTFLEGILLTSLSLNFRYYYRNTSNLSDGVEEIADKLDTLFHEKGYLSFFYIVKEDKLG